MSSVREQILQAVVTKLETVKTALSWASVIRNPRDPIDEAQMHAIVLLDGGEPAPDGLTGHVDDARLDFSIGLLVCERDDDSAEDLIDAGYVAVLDALLDPGDIQLGGIAVGIEKQETGEPIYGRAERGARFLGGMTIDFSVRYQAREGDASTPAP